MKEIIVSTKQRKQVIDITEEVSNTITISEGAVFVSTPHTTACITINEAEHGLLNDLITFSEKLIEGIEFEHDKHDNNAGAHMVASLIGNSRVIFVRRGELLLGTWQRILFVELDGPRTRKIFVFEFPLRI